MTSHLDGNALAGPLADFFSFDITHDDDAMRRVRDACGTRPRIGGYQRRRHGRAVQQVRSSAHDRRRSRGQGMDPVLGPWCDRSRSASGRSNRGVTAPKPLCDASATRVAAVCRCLSVSNLTIARLRFRTRSEARHGGGPRHADNPLLQTAKGGPGVAGHRARVSPGREERQPSDILRWPDRSVRRQEEAIMTTTQTTTRRDSGGKVAPATSTFSADARSVREATTHPIPEKTKGPAGAMSIFPKDVPRHAQRATAERLSAHADPNRDGSWMRSSCR